MVDNKHPAPPAPPTPAAPAAPHTPSESKSPYEVKSQPLPSVGSKDYVAGQPVDEEEQRKVDGEHEAKIKAAAEKTRQDEQKALHKQPEHPDTVSKR